MTVAEGAGIARLAMCGLEAAMPIDCSSAGICCRMVVATGFQAGSCFHALSFRSSLGNVAAFRAQNSSPAAHRGLRQPKVSWY